MITERVGELQANLDARSLQFLTKKLVSDILAYCNRDDDDFPVALIFTAASLLNNHFERLKADEETGSSIPLKKIKQDDTEFEFAVENIDVAEWASGVSIDKIKAQLNVYRRVRAF